MRFLGSLAVVSMLIGGPAVAAEAPPPADSPWRDAGTLRTPGKVEHTSDAVMAWGRARLTELAGAERPPAERAARIVEYIHHNFEFSPARPPTLADFIVSKSGNCYAHARMSAFLLRLAGVPARFMYDVHLESKSPAATEEARAGGTGLFGQYHNDHFWLTYHDGSSWIPFDSSLGIADRSSFLHVKVDEPAGGVANPPFLLWRESAHPEAEMENVTAAFWSGIGRTTIPGVPVADWQALLETVGHLEVADMKQPLSSERQAAIARVGREFFKLSDKP